MNLDEKIRESMKDVVIPLPVSEIYAFGVSLFIWKEAKFEIDICETEPYQPDGSVPMLFFRFAWFELVFQNKTIYKFFYKRKLGYEPRGLE
jgi:hypothetical protein